MLFDFNKLFCYLLILSSSCFLNCATTVTDSGQSSNTKYFSSFAYDKYGIPLLKDEIKPSGLSGESEYYSVRYESGLIDIIYIVKRVDKKQKLLSPFKIIYEWTGKGFKYGYVSSKGIIEKNTEIGKKIIEPLPENGAGKIIKGPLFILSSAPGYIIGTTIFAASGVTGFVIGLKESGPEAYNAVKSVKESEGTILGKYAFHYDSRKRITKLVQFSSEAENEALSETRYYYQAAEIIPYRSVNFSYVDKKKRAIYQK